MNVSKIPVLEKATTGVAGLDHILNGGLPRGHTYLVEGQPGTGKTTLGLQFLREGIPNGETVLYVTLSETKQELEEIAASHGWSLEGIHIYELTAARVAEQLNYEQTVFHTADVELHEVTDEILRTINQLQPDRVVFDSITEIRLMAENPLRYRRQVFSIRQALSDITCTSLFMNVLPSDNSDEAFQSLVHGVLKFERTTPDYGGMRRRMQITKMRGMPYREGYHDFRIHTGGLRVYPRIEVKDPSLQHDWHVISSGNVELDTLLGGGLEIGTSCLFVGQSGTGKSTLATVYAYAAAQRNEPVSIFLFDEHLNTFYKRAEGQGMDLAPLVADGRLHIRQINIGELSPGEFATLVRDAVEQDHARLIAIDSLTGYLNAMPQEKLLVTQMHELLTYLSQCNVLAFLTITQHGIIGGPPIDPIDMSYLSDTVLLMRHFEAEGSVRQAISVVKKRHGLHEKTIREMRITSSGIHFSQPLQNFSGVLTGNPVYEGAHESLLGGIRK
jgi:circadian clock protein KaiC